MRTDSQRTGSTLVLISVSLVALCGIAGLCVDVGYWYHVMARLQAAADASALAGCRLLPDSTAADLEARRCARLNYCTDAEVELVRSLPTDSSSPTRVEVVLARAVSPFFCSALGVRSFAIRARAVAEHSTSSSASGQDLAAATRFAVYAGREFAPPRYQRPDETRFATNRLTVNGAVHTNGSLAVTGTANRFNGPVTAGHTISGGQDTTFASVTEDAPRVPLPDLDLTALANAARSEGHYYRFDKRGRTFTVYDPGTASFVPATPPPGAQFAGSTLHFLNSAEDVIGTYYVENGSVHIDGSRLSGQAAFVADGPVTINGTDLSWGSDARYAFVSLSTANPAVGITGSDSEFDALIYAPRGTVSLSGTDLTINGSLIANNIEQNLAGSSITINYDPRMATLLPVSNASDEYMILVE